VSDILLSGEAITENDLRRAMATMGARTPEQATRSAVEFVAERLGAPAAGWVVSGDPSRLKLVGIRGLPPEAADEVVTRMASLRRADLRSRDGIRQAARDFAKIADSDRASSLEAGPALMLVAAPSSGGEPTLRLVKSLLETSLERLSSVMTAERRNDQLDLSVAWTAHEVKSPLLGAMAALERARLTPGENTEELLGRAQKELEQLARLVDDLLNWAVLGEPIRPEPTDLVPLVREAVEACDLQGGPERVRVLAPPSVRVDGAPSHLRGALANVIRNALLYSPPGSVVKVSVASRDGLAWVTVRDEGSGIPEHERQWVFDPFTRGVEAPRGGKGLGLFVTRRVIEAHGGAIWIESSEEGTTFRIQLPVLLRAEGEETT
jgi:signal transduction histidine kinase